MKRENKYILSVRAEQDIGNIARFTIEKFGVDQSLKYSEELKKTITKLSANPDIGRAYIPTKRKMLLRYKFKTHMIFYYPTPDGIFVVRVLGGRMNFRKHIK